MEGSLGLLTQPAASDHSVTIRDVIASLATVRPFGDGAALIDQLRDLEDLKSAAAGFQARIAVAFDGLERRSQREPALGPLQPAPRPSAWTPAPSSTEPATPTSTGT